MWPPTSAHLAAHHPRATAQDRGDDFRGDEIDRHAQQRQRREGPAAHRVHITEGVSRGDAAVRGRVVHDGSKKIHRLHQGTIARERQAVDASVIGCGAADDQQRVVRRAG